MCFLPSVAGFPNVYYYGHKGGYNIMVMDLLGPNLDELFGLCDHQFSQKTVAMLAKRMVKGLACESYTHTHTGILIDPFDRVLYSYACSRWYTILV